MLPDLSQAPYIAVDLETRDPNLKSKGPGGVRGDGYTVGIAVAVPGWKAYLPVRHEGGGNLDKGFVLRWLKQQMSLPCPKIFANALYDVEWLVTDGVKPVGPWYDVLTAAFLLDENQRSYSLESVGQRMLGEGKIEDGLDRYAREKWGKKAEAKPNIWRMPPDVVAPYAEQDADLTLRLFEHQRPLLEQEGLWKLFTMESKLLEMLAAMRQLGVRVDVDKAAAVREGLSVREARETTELLSLAGCTVGVWSSASIAKAFDAHGLAYPTTDLGSPSFTRAWLEQHPHAIAQGIVRVRKLNRLRSNFVENMVMKSHVHGRLFCSFNPRGAVTGRFSSSNPNLQQVPARDEELASLVRGLFLPEEGHDWASLDYSQIEPRITVHYAYRRGFPKADIARDRYRSDRATDYHSMVADMTGIDRRPAKTINLSLSYGMGKRKLAASLGLELEEAEKLFDTYHDALPFMRALSDDVGHVASRRGYITTLMGRRRRFNLWERADRKWDEDWEPPIELELAKSIHEGHPLKRAMTYRAMNALIQGSAADIMKKAMVMMFEAGHIPHLTVHDEVCLSVSRGGEGRRVINEVKEIMEHCVQLEVPLLAKVSVGPSWGDAK